MIRKIAMRELKTRARTRAFKVTTVILLLGAVAATILPAILGGDDGLDGRDVAIGIVGDLEPRIETGLDGGIPDIIDANLQRFSDIDAAEEALADDDVAVVIDRSAGTDDTTLVWNEQVDLEVSLFVNSYLDPGLPDLLAYQSGLGERFLDPAEDSDAITITLSFVGLFTTFALIQGYGQLVLMGTVEEKSSRVIEVLLSHVKPRQLLAGKVLGIGLLGLLQATIVAAALVGALLATRDVDIPPAAWRFIPLFMLCLAFGFGLYAVLLAAAGSLISRQEDAAQVMVPVMAPVMVAYFLGFTSIGNPETTLTRVLSLIPFTSPFILPIRIAHDTIPMWELALALGLLAVTIWLLVRLGGRIYQESLLRIGTRINWREAARFARG